MKEYVILHDGVYQITGTRVLLDVIVHKWNEGASPESIRESFPSLSLLEVYGAIVFYLENKETVDEHLRQAAIIEDEIERKHREATKDDPFYRRIRKLWADRQTDSTPAGTTQQ